MEREKLTSPQQVVNFLLDSYWWQNKPGSTTRAQVEDSGQKPPQAAPKSKIKHTYDWYIKAIQDLEFDDEYKSMCSLIKSDDDLSNKQKENLYLLMKNK